MHQSIKEIWSEHEKLTDRQMNGGDYIIQGVVGEAKVSCSFCHSGGQLVLAYSWARSTVLAAGRGRGGMLLFLLFFHFLSFPSFFPIPLFHLLFYLFSPFLWEKTQNDTQGLTCH